MSAGVVEAPGVSRELAAFRAGAVTNLRYDVSFTIPEDMSMPVTGRMTAVFDYTPGSPGILPLDFKATSDQIDKVTVNGRQPVPVVKNEHIIIPDSLLRKGRNEVEVTFISPEAGLNRRDGYVYTLFVPDRARATFPCFDQPDMKASFSLSLTVPEAWKAVGNTYQREERPEPYGMKTIVFAPTEPLSTYLFAFAAGEFYKTEYENNGRLINAYHRETDSARVAQLPDIFADVIKSLEWQEKHTGIAYPFAKYDLVILPGFQFGGMEHTGATFYNDKSLFLGENPTPDEYLNRSSLIAHETSHMWFGDLVTMRWFDDVWTKEVFANYYAAEITRELLPEFDHDIEWLREYTAAAMSEDRSDGRTAIRQSLDNLNNAGLVYNDIIYNKAPVMLSKLVDLMGKEAYRDGIREYLATFSYGNADWDELIEILSRHTEEDVKEFSRVWVYEKGMPVITVAVEGDSLVVSQSDPLGRGNVWPQGFSAGIVDGTDLRLYDVSFVKNDRVTVPLGFTPSEKVTVIPNYNGKGYGRFVTSPGNMTRLLDMLIEDREMPAVTKMALMMGLYENYLAGEIDAMTWADFCISCLRRECNGQMSSSLVDYLGTALRDLPVERRQKVEKTLWSLTSELPAKSGRTALARILISRAVTPEVCDTLLALWERGASDLLGEKDFMRLSYQLAVRYPEAGDSILSVQRGRLRNPDRIAEFDYISRAAVGDSASRDSLFRTLVIPANRRIEPWTVSLLQLIFHPLREEESRGMVTDALMLLPEVQHHGDIFYPAKWSRAVLSGMTTAGTWRIVNEVINSRQFDGSLLRNKIQNAAYSLSRRNRR